MSAFDDAFAALLGNEGGFVDNPADPGGATRYGITQRIARAGGYSGDMRDLPIEFAKRIAKANYWDVMHCDEYDARVAFQLFDCVYNGGKPVLWSQEACGVTADGKLGPMTIAAIKAADPHAFIMKFLSYRMLYLCDLKTFSNFGKGWTRRIASNLARGAA